MSPENAIQDRYDAFDATERALAEAIYAAHVAPKVKEIEDLKEQRDRYFNALEKIKEIRWGNDGDCGALAIIDNVL